jgi:hypothetical protein
LFKNAGGLKNTFGAALAGRWVWLKEHYPDAEQKDLLEGPLQRREKTI